MKIIKEEVQEWIEFLYKDLLNDDIYIGGYFFRFDQLPEFEQKQKQIDILIQTHLTTETEKTIQHNKKDENAQCSATQLAQIECLDSSLNIIVPITTKNKFNDIKTFPCTQEEFYFVFNELQQAKLDVEHFKEFLLDELKETKQEDLPAFMQFINDLLEDTRLKFTGKTHNIALS